jgi:hypothetical protein
VAPGPLSKQDLKSGLGPFSNVCSGYITVEFDAEDFFVKLKFWHSMVDVVLRSSSLPAAVKNSLYKVLLNSPVEECTVPL